MTVAFVNPFIQAASEVLAAECGSQAQRGSLRVHESALTTDEVTALVGVSGEVNGMVLYSMSAQPEVIGTSGRPNTATRPVAFRLA